MRQVLLLLNSVGMQERERKDYLPTVTSIRTSPRPQWLSALQRDFLNIGVIGMEILSCKQTENMIRLFAIWVFCQSSKHNLCFLFLFIFSSNWWNFPIHSTCISVFCSTWSSKFTTVTFWHVICYSGVLAKLCVLLRAADDEGSWDGPSVSSLMLFFGISLVTQRLVSKKWSDIRHFQAPLSGPLLRGRVNQGRGGTSHTVHA